jgi:hypothetical protein
MQRGRSGRSLGERAAESGVRPETSSTGLQSSPAGATGTAYPAAGDSGQGRHCWVRDPPDSPGTWPGLLVEWRQRGSGWQGRVVYTVTGPHGPALVESWLPAARLEPR